MTDPHSVPRDSRRVPLEARVQLSFERFTGFISEYSSNISPGGMFIRTREPKPPGTVLGFELRLGDGFELIRGRGEVVWVRQVDESAQRQAGMGIRFRELSPGSRDLIYRMVDQHILDGGTPFDLAALGGPEVPAVTIPPPVAAGPEDSAPVDLPDLSAEPFPEIAMPPDLPVAASGPPSAAAALASVPSGPPPVLSPSVSPGLPPVASSPPSAAAPARVAPGLHSAAPSGIPREPPAAEAAPWPEPLRTAPPPAASAVAAIPEAPRPAPPPLQRPAVRWRVLRWGALAALAGLVALAFLNQETLLRWVLRRDQASAPPPLVVSGGAPPAAPRPVAVAAAENAVPPGDAAPAPETGAASGAPAPPATEAPAAPIPLPGPAAPPDASPEPPAAAERAPSPAPASASTVTQLQRITWEQGTGGTDLVLWGNGSFGRESYVHLRIDGEPPRELIRLVGIRHPFAERLTVGTRQVRQVRTGLHPGAAGSELHVVLDLTGPGVEITSIDPGEGRLRIHLQGE